MIKAIGWLVKITLFSVFILILGNRIKWGGKTVSDHVKMQLSHAERSDVAGSLRKWTSEVGKDAQDGASKVGGALKTSAVERGHSNEKRRPEDHPPERIQSSERQKLRALIQELNSSTSADSRSH